MKHLILLFLLSCSSPGGECDPGEIRCNPSTLTSRDTCLDNQNWHEQDITPMFCVDRFPMSPCNIDCDLGEGMPYGDEIWICLDGDLCDGPYFQRGDVH